MMQQKIILRQQLPLHLPLLVLLPILPEYRQAYREFPLLRSSVDMAGGLRDLAEWCFKCGKDWEAYRYGVSEYVFGKLDAPDIDPRQERFNREKISNFLLSDYFHLFLHNFFDMHSYTYEYLLGQPTSDFDPEPIDPKRNDVIAVRLTPH